MASMILESRAECLPEVDKGAIDVKGHLDRKRVASLLADANADALLLLKPGSIKYASGASAGNVMRFDRPGAGFLIVPADPNTAPSALIGDYYVPSFVEISGIVQTWPFPIWVETADISGTSPLDGSLRERLRSVSPQNSIARPATFDQTQNMEILNQLLTQMGLAGARIAVESDCLSVADDALLRRYCPKVEWVDGVKIIARLRMIKSKVEIALLETAAAAAEYGVERTLETLRDGMQPFELAAIWREQAIDKAAILAPGAQIDAWASVTIGKVGYGPEQLLAIGDLIKMDVGVVIDGYSSDSARTFAYGQPSDDARDVYQAIHQAHAAMVEKVEMGTSLGTLHRAALTTMHDHGFDSYQRGHFGHGLGAANFSEEWPFVGRDEEEVIQPGMVIALEVPWYIRGLGPFMIEDQYTIRESGPSRAWRLPTDLVIL